MACNHFPWTSHTVGRRRAWHATIAFGQKHMVRLRRVWHAIIHLGHHIELQNVECFMLLSSLNLTHDRTTSGIACPHVPWATNTVRRHRARHSILAVRQYTRSDDVVHGMLSLTLESTYGQTTSSVTCHHHRFYEKCLLTH